MEKKLKQTKNTKLEANKQQRNQHFTLETFLLPFYGPRLRCEVRFKPLVRSGLIFPRFFFG